MTPDVAKVVVCEDMKVWIEFRSRGHNRLMSSYDYIHRRRCLSLNSVASSGLKNRLGQLQVQFWGLHHLEQDDELLSKYDKHYIENRAEVYY